MQLFYAPDVDFAADGYTLSEEESRHCVRVLRLAEGDAASITDGRGTLCHCRIESADPHGCRLRFTERIEGFERRPYYLQMAVAPTKNVDRFEWFAEKATEIGIDRLTPLLTEHCERRVLRTDRIERVAVGAVKQSQKAYMPAIDELTPFAKVVSEPFDGIKLIAHCAPDARRVSMREAVDAGCRVLVLIGPEGDFSPKEVEEAVRCGFRPVWLGPSRLRTETAALVAVHSVAFINEP